MNWFISIILISAALAELAVQGFSNINVGIGFGDGQFSEAVYHILGFPYHIVNDFSSFCGVVSQMVIVNCVLSMIAYI